MLTKYIKIKVAVLFLIFNSSLVYAGDWYSDKRHGLYYGKLIANDYSRIQAVARCEIGSTIKLSFPVSANLLKINGRPLEYNLKFKNGQIIKGKEFISSSEMFLEIKSGEVNLKKAIFGSSGFTLNMSEEGGNSRTYTFSYYASDAIYSLNDLYRSCK